MLAGGCNIEGEDDSYDFGSGAGFYVNATEEKWKTNYRMYAYVTQELRALVDKYFNTTGKQSIFGHRFGFIHHLVIVWSYALQMLRSRRCEH